MFRFLLRRVLEGGVTIVVATFLLFGVMTLLPGDPVRAVFGLGPVDQEAYDAIARRLHLDQPYLVQYWHFLENLVTLRLGSTLQGVPIRSLVETALPHSLRIAGGVFALQFLFAPVVVALSGLRPHSPADRLGTGMSVALVSVPALVAAMLLQGLAVALSPNNFIESASTLNRVVLPILALGLGTAGHLALVGREELLAALSHPFVRVARAYGVPHGRIVALQAFRPSLGPTIQLLAANLAVLITGLIVVEGVFGVPGVGGLLLDAIRSQDRLLTVTLLGVLLVGVIVLNTLADLVHGWLDPRLRDDSGLSPR